MAFEQGLAKADAEDFLDEQSRRTELSQDKAREHMKESKGFTYWRTKTKTKCIKCKAEADGISVDEARRNHMESINAKDVQRANAWKKTIERT